MAGLMHKFRYGMAVVAVTLTSVFIQSCMINVEIPRDTFTGGLVAVPDQQTRQSGLRAGLYMDAEVRDATYAGGGGGPHPLRVKFGDSLVHGCEETARLLFSDVVIVDSLNEQTVEGNYDFLVVPRLERLDIHLRMKTSSITMKWTILDKNSRILYANSFTGVQDNCKFYMMVSTVTQECLADAIRDHFRKAAIGLASVQWWKELRERTASAPDTGHKTLRGRGQTPF